jgi:UDP-glucose 4-epimerase
MLDPEAVPVKRNFVHVDDLVSALLAAIDHPKARQQLFNICMDEPVDYGEMGKYLNETRGLPPWRSRPNITPRGSITPKQSFYSAGDLNMI